MDVGSEMFSKLATALSFFPFSLPACLQHPDDDAFLLNTLGRDGVKSPCSHLRRSCRRACMTTSFNALHDRMGEPTPTSIHSCKTPSHSVPTEDAMMPIRCMSPPLQRRSERKVSISMSGDSAGQDGLPVSMVLSLLRCARSARTGQHIIKEKNGQKVLKLASYSAGDASSVRCANGPLNSLSHSIAVENATMPIMCIESREPVQSKLVVPLSEDAVCVQAEILNFSSSRRLVRALQHAMVDKAADLA